MAVGDPSPTVCPYCGETSVYVHAMRADGAWVNEKLCTACQRTVP